MHLLLFLNLIVAVGAAPKNGQGSEISSVQICIDGVVTKCRTYVGSDGSKLIALIGKNKSKFVPVNAACDPSFVFTIKSKSMEFVAKICSKDCSAEEWREWSSYL